MFNELDRMYRIGKRTGYLDALKDILALSVESSKTKWDAHNAKDKEMEEKAQIAYSVLMGAHDKMFDKLKKEV